MLSFFAASAEVIKSLLVNSDLIMPVNKPLSFISPTKLFHIQDKGFANQDIQLTFNKEGPNFQIKLGWLWPEPCTFGIMCNKLTGYPCADYGLEITLPNLKKIDICHQNHIYSGNMSFNSILTVNI